MKHPVIIIQARLGSTRLPGKVLAPVAGRPMISWLLERLAHSKLPVVLAVPGAEVSRFEELGRDYPVQVFGGSELDVLDRYTQAARANSADPVIRVTGDNPLTSVECLLLCLEKHGAMQADLTHPDGLPYGAGVEVISRQALEAAWVSGKEPEDREHVTRYVYKNPGRFEIVPMPVPDDYRDPTLRVTIDTEEDLRRFAQVAAKVKPRRYLRLLDAMKWLRENPGKAPAETAPKESAPAEKEDAKGAVAQKKAKAVRKAPSKKPSKK